MYCNECKKTFPEDQLTKCSTYDETETEWLCRDCLGESIWYCHSCGQFCAGITSYEFGPYAGFCDNCADEIADSCYDGEDDEYSEEDFDEEY
jgi:hypothetical protein